MRFAKITYILAGIWGLIVLTPLYFLEQSIGLKNPPAITHPEYFYGFVGVGLAWQIAFLIIGTNPVRYRTLMIPCMIEKFSFAIACAMLYMHQRIAAQVFGSSLVDLLFGVLFVVAYVRTRSSQ